MNKQEVFKYIAEKRKQKKLHGIVIKKISEIMKNVNDEYYPVGEIIGLAGGRNDLILFEYSKRKVLFEVFASYTQVSRDLRILDSTKADVKIAVIIDKEIDKKVFEKICRENPENNYPFIFISELFCNDKITQTVLKLKEIIDGSEISRVKRIIKKLMSFENFVDTCKSNDVTILSIEDIEANNVNFMKVFIALIGARLHKLGISAEKSMKVMKWLSNEELFEFILLKIIHGFNTILFTDVDNNFGIYSDVELLDWIRIINEIEEPYVLLSMNNIYHEITDKFFTGDEIKVDKEIRIFAGQSQVHSNNSGNEVIFSLPKNTKNIIIMRPMQIEKDKEFKEITAEEYLGMINIV